MTVLGVDLAANPRNASGIAVLDGRALLALGTARADDEVLAVAREHAPDVIALDAPLTPPDGRSGTYANRAAERALRAAGFRALPPSMLGSLTFRGMHLSRRLADAGFTVIEVFPRATLARVGLAFAGKKTEKEGVAAARVALARHVDGLPPALPDDHAADAVAAALTAALHVEGRTVAYGDADEGRVWVPVAPERGA